MNYRLNMFWSRRVLHMSTKSTVARLLLTWPRTARANDTFARAVRDLCIHIDSDLTMQAHVAKSVPNGFAVLRQIRSVRRLMTKPFLQWLVVSMVLTRLDFGRKNLIGLPN